MDGHVLLVAGGGGWGSHCRGKVLMLIVVVSDVGRC